ncbi:DNA internalization-related competence protein ComEC/Rec2 [Bacillus tianshenii]|uniref:DNA internalization-related competence protein ComEC/Rec2 n=1 Tax=Sutcliffiella tianshenii TaxID=1463404 RepID=UPI001CD61ED0|nr:DNA internalization-related competence protein ComEC/Rec2 [Bacillus tianshenii]MCA1318870.1 DNA internalization-related competence protein ComEC/Rec2 [Bacillus tianshenii]
MNQTGNFAYLAVAGCLGIAVSSYSFHWGLLTLTCCYLLWMWLGLKRSGLACAALMVGIGYGVYYSVIDRANISQYTVRDTEFSGEITHMILRDGNKISFRIDTEREETLLIEYYMDTENEFQSFSSLQIGDNCSFLGSLKEPLPPTNPHAFDYKRFLYHQHIHWTLTLIDAPTECTSSPSPSFHTALKQWRVKGMKLINDEVEQPVSGFMISLLFGERGYMDEEILETYQLLGLVHLLAISGLHVGVVTAAIFLIGIRLGVTRAFMNGTLLLFLQLYVIVAGAAPSVIRAGIMTGVVLLYLMMKKRFLSIDAIGVACMIILLINPYYLYHIGFQLSFIVSLCLILSAKRLRTLPHKSNQLLYVSIVAQLASLPVILYHFFQFSIWSPLLNLIFVPFYSLFVLPLSFFIFFCLIISPDIVPVILPLLKYPLLLMNGLAEGVAGFSFGTLVFGRPPLYLMVGYILSVLFIFYKMENVTFKRSWKAMCFLMICFIFHWNIGLFQPGGKAVVLDIGQGDAIYIRLPHNRGTYLIDTGGVYQFEVEEWKRRKKQFDGGKSILVPFLKAEGIRELDKLFLTHGDYDHIGNVPSLLNEIKVKDLYVPVGFGREGGEMEREVMSEAAKRKISVQVVDDSSGWKAGEASFQFLHPSKVYKDKNDGSIVLYAEFGGLSWLFTGDIEAAGERDLIQRYPELKADVLKAAHHGSGTSSLAPFLDRLDPDYVLISAGRNNRFGHPHAEVLERIEGIGSMHYRTDEQGAILYIFTQRGGTFSTQLP